ncbi:MAG: C39 family peptidase [Defluviitaleaceae bacterium]|nr:C39 family peptidase [Defluviitaleaceae bacterium]
MVKKKFVVFIGVVLVLVILAATTAFFWIMRVQVYLAQQPEIPREEWYSARMLRSDFSAATTRDNFEAQQISQYTPVFENMGDDTPKDVIYLHIVQVLERHDDWTHIRTFNGDKWIYENWHWIPSELQIEDVPGFNQQELGLFTGCEIVALAMVINRHVEIDVLDLVEQMPRSEDPLLGFRGDPFSSGGFTILPPALLELTERHIGSAIDMTGASIEDIQAQLVEDRPVLTWLRGMFGFNVHVIVITGFNQYGFFYNDPWLGGVGSFIEYDYFLAMWEDPILDLRLDRVYPPRMALSY